MVCGPFSLEEVAVAIEEDPKAYPAGVSEAAESAWDLKVKEAPEVEDAPVWCLLSAERTPQLRLKMQYSSQKLLHYTHFCDAAKSLDQDSRCNACGLALLVETLDGHLVVVKAEASWSLLPGMDALFSCSLKESLSQALCPFESLGTSQAALESARILGLLDASKEAPNGYRHILVASCRLPQTAPQVAAGLSSGAKALGFAPLPGTEAVEGVETVALEDLLRSEAPLLPELQRRAVWLMRELMALKQSGQ
mmetsp:Transcript_47759/g.107200  ORF Transcript_47759/g.107200 Transcript_47759/m.107200 type:complete len:251 (-) Transcript_47759:17-769(-)